MKIMNMLFFLTLFLNSLTPLFASEIKENFEEEPVKFVTGAIQFRNYFSGYSTEVMIKDYDKDFFREINSLRFSINHDATYDLTLHYKDIRHKTFYILLATICFYDDQHELFGIRDIQVSADYINNDYVRLFPTLRL
ncbi:MAG: hypothetical protein JNK42_06025 [Caedimonas sp.]|jgi:hypothetical protein|nr:hypothetical protein [Caedimonas sp.]